METIINIENFILEKYNEAKAPEKTLEMVFLDETKALKDNHGQERCTNLIFPFARSQLQKVPIKDCLYIQEADDKHNKDIMEITLDIKDFNEFEWQPGDTIAILPSNSKENVNDLLNFLNLNEKADQKCQVKVASSCTKKTAKVPAYIPSISTPREILQDCLNIRSVLKKQFLSSLADYCTNHNEKAFLKCLSSKEGSSFYNNLIIEKGLNLLDILNICTSCKPCLTTLIEHLPRLLPRPYSIANSPLQTKEEITLIFSILNTKPGVATNMLKEKSETPSASLLVYLRESNLFRYTQEDYGKNQILITIGTGLAPFLGFLQHKECLTHNACNTQPPGQTWLFAGSTTEQAMLHRHQLLKWQSNNVLNKFIESHSRIVDAPYQYVQDSLNAHSQELVDLLLNPATVLYLCADGAQISKSIEKCLHNILAKELNISETEATEMLKDFKNNGKYREDLWL